VKSALAVLAHRERLMEQMRAFVAETESESGVLTDDELDAAREYFR